MPKRLRKFLQESQGSHLEAYAQSCISGPHEEQENIKTEKPELKSKMIGKG